jgi:hypothetical protein
VYLQLFKFHSKSGSLMFVVFHNFSQNWRNTFSSTFPQMFAVSFVSLLICFNILYHFVLFVSCFRFVTNLSQEALCLLLTSLLASVVFLLYPVLSFSFFDVNHFLYHVFFLLLFYFVISHFKIFSAVTSLYCS